MAPLSVGDKIITRSGTRGTVTRIIEGDTFPVRTILDGEKSETMFALHELTKSDVPRTFSVYRTEDISANHDANQMNPPDEVQYFGTIFPSGKAVINWNTAIKSVSVFDSLDDLWKIHGHAQDGYGTEVLWHDTGVREVLK
jgi:hypothetical protein